MHPFSKYRSWSSRIDTGIKAFVVENETHENDIHFLLNEKLGNWTNVQAKFTAGKIVVVT